MNTPAHASHAAPSLRRIAITVVLLVAASDFLLLQHPLGWNVAAFTLLLGGALVLRFPLLRRGKERPVVAGRILLVLLCGSLLYRPTLLNMLLTVIGLVSLAAICHHGGQLPTIQNWWRGILLFVPAGWLGFWTDLAAARRLRTRRRRARGSQPPPLPRHRTNLASWGITALFGVLFLILFAIANPVLKRLLDDLWNWLLRLLLPTPQRIGWWLLTTPLIWALFRYRLAHKHARTGAGTTRDATAPSDPLAAVARYLPTPRVLTRSLALFNAIFLLQNILDLAFLWGHAALPDGMTYAEYAHRGAYPLVATAVLAGLFLLITFRGESSGRDFATARKLVYVWVAQNMILTLSAAWRLRAYVSIYSLTRLRLSAVLWMVLVVGGLALICLRIVRRRSNAWLMSSNTALLMGLLYICCFLNTDGFIARFNVARCREVTGQGQPLDVSYMRHLGDSAIPALRWMVAQEAVTLPDRRRLGALLTSSEYRLQTQLDDWRGWSYQRRSIVNAARQAEPPRTTKHDPQPGGNS